MTPDGEFRTGRETLVRRESAMAMPPTSANAAAGLSRNKRMTNAIARVAAYLAKRKSSHWGSIGFLGRSSMALIVMGALCFRPPR